MQESKRKTVKIEINARKRSFEIDENVSSGEIYALMDDVDSANEFDIDNFMNDSDTEYIGEGDVQPE